MSNLTDTQLGQNYRRAQGFSNFNSRNVVFYTVYFAPKTMSFFDDYNNNTANNEFSQLLQTIAFAGIELFFIGRPGEFMGGVAIIIGVNSDTSNMGDFEVSPGIFLAGNLNSALNNANWMSYVLRNVVDHDSIHSPSIGG